jgi:hypothetical protein
VIDRFQQVADLSRMVHNSLAFGHLSQVQESKAHALVKTASGEFMSPLLPVLNRLAPSVGEACLLIAPQGKPEQGVLLCLGRDMALQAKLAQLEQRLAMLEQS